jgi:hypothetical protein
MDISLFSIGIHNVYIDGYLIKGATQLKKKDCLLETFSVV